MTPEYVFFVEKGCLNPFFFFLGTYFLNFSVIVFFFLYIKGLFAITHSFIGRHIHIPVFCGYSHVFSIMRMGIGTAIWHEEIAYP